MRKDISIEDIVCNIFHRDNSLEEHAADLGELIIEREREESRTVKEHHRLAELNASIAAQKKLLRRLLNGDEGEFVPKPPKRPQLRVVK
jgi:hypothetical protein